MVKNKSRRRKLSSVGNKTRKHMGGGGDNKPEKEEFNKKNWGRLTRIYDNTLPLYGLNNIEAVREAVYASERLRKSNSKPLLHIPNSPKVVVNNSEEAVALRKKLGDTHGHISAFSLEELRQLQRLREEGQKLLETEEQKKLEQEEAQKRIAQQETTERLRRLMENTTQVIGNGNGNHQQLQTKPKRSLWNLLRSRTAKITNQQRQQQQPSKPPKPQRRI